MKSSTPDRVDTESEATAATTPLPSGRHLPVGRLVAVALGGAMALLVTLLATNIGGIATSAPNPLVGELVPAVSGVTLNGDAFDIDDHRGSWLAVNFFASWCVACRQEHPELVAWRADHSASGDAELLTIVMGDTDEAVRRFFEERGGGDWPVLGEDYWSYSLAFGVTAVPETFMVAPSGMIVAHLTGAVTADELDAVIERHSPATARPTSRDPSAGPSPAPE